MTCRHKRGDPDCSSYPSYIREQERIKFAEIGEALAKRTPNPDDYEVIEVQNLCGNIVMKVQYSSCEECSFDSMKVMVFLNVDILAAMKWRRIDPHFDDKPRTEKEAPSPNARFPATEQGWKDALKFAGNRKQPVYRSRGLDNEPEPVQDNDVPA